MNATVPKIRISYARAKGEVIVEGLTAFQFDSLGVATVDWLGTSGTDAESLVRRHGCYGASVAFDDARAEMPASSPSVTGPVAAEILPGPEGTTLSPDVSAMLHPAFQVVMEEAGAEDTVPMAQPAWVAVEETLPGPAASADASLPEPAASPYASLVTPPAKKRR